MKHEGTKKDGGVFTDLQHFRLLEHMWCGRERVGGWKESRQVVRTRTQF